MAWPMMHFIVLRMRERVRRGFAVYPGNEISPRGVIFLGRREGAREGGKGRVM